MFYSTHSPHELISTRGRVMLLKLRNSVLMFAGMLFCLFHIASVQAIPITFDATTTGTIELLGTTGSVSVSSSAEPPVFTDSGFSGLASASTAGTIVSEISGTQSAHAMGSVAGSPGSSFAESLTSLTYSVLNTSDPTAPIAGSATFLFTYTLDIFRTDPLATGELAHASSFVELNFLEATGASVSESLFDGLTFFRDFIDTSTDGTDVTETPLPFEFTIFVDDAGVSSGFVTAVDAMGFASVEMSVPGTLLLFGIGLLLLRRMAYQ